MFGEQLTERMGKELFDSEQETTVLKKKPVKTKALTVVDQPQQTTPASLLVLAIEKGMDMDKLEKLIEMQNQWEAKQAKKAYQKAFARFQEICPDLTKNRAGYDNRYRFQDLPDIIKHIRKPLAECGLSYHWGQKDEVTKISIWCIIEHEDGHKEIGEPLESEPDVSGQKIGIHAKGSIITYLRRYTLTGMLGLASADADDDGQKSSKLKPINEKQFSATLAKIMKGEATLEKTKEFFILSPEQEQALVKAEEAFKNKKA